MVVPSLFNIYKIFERKEKVGIKIMEFETMLNSIKGSFNIESMNMTEEVEKNIRLMESGDKTISQCIQETIDKYTAMAKI